jgi:hypothetical protein
MYHPPSKRKEIIRRTVIYSFMSAVVIGLVTALVLIMLGYQFNRNDGRIEQGGLVQFDSRPTGANVTIDGANFGTRTPSKTTLSAGQHYVTMQLEGYKTWQKSIDVVPGSVLWLNYTRFVPNELTPMKIADFAMVSSTAVSPDSKWMAIKEDPGSPMLHLADITGDDVKLSNVPLPTTAYTHPQTGKTQTFAIVSWDPSSRYILTKHVYDDGKTEWLVVDSQDPAATQNLTKLLSIDASKVVFSGNNSKILYAQVGTDVRRIDVQAATLSGPLASNVAEFSLYKNETVVFATLLDPETKQRSLGYYNDSSDKTHIVRSYTDDGASTMRLAIGEYFRETYFAIAYSNSIEVLKGDFSGPSKLTAVATMDMPTGSTQYLSMGNEGRFVIAQHSGTYMVYDLELKKPTTTSLKGESEVTRELQWLDKYTPWSDRDNILRMYEFDGANQHNIMPVAPGFSATFSPNAKYLYGITKTSDTSYHLKRVRMILP